MAERPRPTEGSAPQPVGWRFPGGPEAFARALSQGRATTIDCDRDPVAMLHAAVAYAARTKSWRVVDNRPHDGVVSFIGRDSWWRSSAGQQVTVWIEEGGHGRSAHRVLGVARPRGMQTYDWKEGRHVLRRVFDAMVATD